jgi:peptidoglycan hydrolase-like protein with peptidoglycan-binding domain
MRKILSSLFTISLMTTPFVSAVAHASSYTFTRSATIGSRNPDVSALQQILINDGYLTGITYASGYFGAATKAALISYQKAKGISPATGYFGPLTMASLNALSTNGGINATKPPSPISPPSPPNAPAVSSPPATNNTNAQNNVSGTQTVNYDWSTFSALPDNFSKNPPAYIGTKVKMSASVLDFLARGDRGGDTNLIEVMAMDNTIIGTKVGLEVDNDPSYQLATESLNKLDAVVAYGTIGTSETFYTSAGGVSVLPTLQIVRLDKCGSQLLCSQSNTPQTIFSPSTTSTNTTTNVPPQSSVAPTPAATPAPASTSQPDRASVLATLKANASAKWGADYQMVQYEYNTEIQAYDQVESQTAFPDIMAAAKSKWGDDYSMVEYEYTNQVAAYQWIAAQTAYPSIMAAAKQKWGTDYEMVKYEYNNQVQAYQGLNQ